MASYERDELANVAWAVERLVPSLAGGALNRYELYHLRLVRQFQYARWVDGTTVLWLARRKGVGRGEGTSGLRFDVLEEA